MTVTGVSVNDFDVAAKILLLETLSSITRKHVRHVDYDILCLVGFREGVLVKTSPLAAGQLDGNAGAEERLVVPDFSNLPKGSVIHPKTAK